MRIFTCLHALLLTVVLSAPALAQTSVTPNPDHASLLGSADPQLAANKRLVYDFWREVFEAGQVSGADKYVAESYIQHNPNVPDGRAAMVGFISRRTPVAKPVEAQVKAPLVSIVAERDIVVLGFVREYPDPKDGSRKYTTTWFDMFRIENGKIAEHWDSAMRQ
ncbi:nuclear transport factor 2 family protein [Variovorax fucosicus]|uniref:nuclear transport factor 2 family protein n=1 Tax=Variovorax fucosicus TaxID=3053517 RepID=UPI002578D1F2|nr:nuclear transport factor 2 family protein [Variovorax sp. J22G47]MDM0059116.1 ester cyclase [Variovorax sp. J22G47]